MSDVHTAFCRATFTALVLACCRGPGTPGSAPPADAAATGAVPTVDSSARMPDARGGSQTDALVPPRDETADYEGMDSQGIPRYATTLSLSSEEAELLRRAYGIEEPHRLYVSDSTEEGLLKYDTQVKRCLTCYVNSYRVGFVSVRRVGESWEETERRVRTSPPRLFTGGETPASRSTDDLDPEVRGPAEEMLRAARALGFRIEVTATYRSPLREAFLMAEGRGRTHTLTSNHSYGRALDVVVDDGNRANARTRADWIAFRRWVTHHPTASGQSFRILGAVDKSWDWAHVELPSAHTGFHSVPEAIALARACLGGSGGIPCNFPPHLPGLHGDLLVH